MIRKTKRLTSVILALIISVSVFTTVSFTVSASSVITEGACGGDARYTMYNDNVLVISGTGAMNDYALHSSGDKSTAPWSDYYPYTGMGLMQKIIIAGGITHVGKYAFYMPTTNRYEVNVINIGDSVVSIGEHAFCNEKELASVTIPRNVTDIGDCAFDGCNDLKTVNCYAAPATLNWDIGESGLASDCKIHVMGKNLTAYQTKFSAYSQRFVGDLSEPTNVIPEGKNILVSYDDISPSIFGGALAYSVKAVNSKGVWPITYGARGFVTCIEDSSNYYALTNNNSGTLSLMNTDLTSGRATETSDEIYTKASVKISHEYIGSNSVKMIYTVKNKSSGSVSFKMGSSGDIKIGSDDYATINELTNNSTDIGITMTSNAAGDKITQTVGETTVDKYPTLGFAGKQVGGSSSDATFFYGKVGANKAQSATAVKSDIFIPERIFNMNDASGYQSKTSGTLSSVDSGLSFYWNITLSANEEKQYAVIFSVPNTSSGSENSTVIEEVQSNIGTNTTGTYKTADNKTIYLNNEVVPRPDDTLAGANGYSSLKNFLLLGVQKKPELKGRTGIRYISVINTNILKDAAEYGYIVAKTTKFNSADARDRIGQVEYDSPNIYKKDIKGTSNLVSGDYGDYSADTPYKYVTLGINDLPDDNTVYMVRFYVKREYVDEGVTKTEYTYADYYADDGERYDGCAAKLSEIIGG